MSEYAVLWTDSTDPHPLWMGSLRVSADGLVLRGSDGHRTVLHAIPLKSIANVKYAGPVEGSNGYPSLCLELRPERCLTVTSLMGAEIISELFDTLLRLLPPA